MRGKGTQLIDWSNFSNFLNLLVFIRKRERKEMKSKKCWVQKKSLKKSLSETSESSQQKLKPSAKSNHWMKLYSVLHLVYWMSYKNSFLINGNIFCLDSIESWD